VEKAVLPLRRPMFPAPVSPQQPVLAINQIKISKKNRRKITGKKSLDELDCTP
jgi:hypothetical protein